MVDILDRVATVVEAAVRESSAEWGSVGGRVFYHELPGSSRCLKDSFISRTCLHCGSLRLCVYMWLSVSICLPVVFCFYACLAVHMTLSLFAYLIEMQK